MDSSQIVVIKILILICLAKHAVKTTQLLNFKNLKLVIKNNLKIFHNNINGLETKHELLQNFLANNTMSFDIAITETSLKPENINFQTNIAFQGYKYFSTASNSSKGGSTIYVKNDLDILERQD